MSDSITRAGELLRARIREIDEERPRLERALSQLNPSRPSSQSRQRRSTPARQSATGRAARSTKRKIAPAGQRQRQLVEYLRQHPGARPTEIAGALGVTPSNVQNILRQARNQRLVAKEGNGYRLAKRAAPSKT
jgi:DNA-directed RNA polymerase specialized sigma24 family protein